MYKYSVTGHGDNRGELPVACNDGPQAIAMVHTLIKDGYQVVEVAERVGESNVFRHVQTIDTRWMSEL